MVMYTNFTAANILTAEAGIFVGIIAMSLWVMRLTISTYWLTVFGEIAKAVTTAVITVTTRWGLVGITVPARGVPRRAGHPPRRGRPRRDDDPAGDHDARPGAHRVL